MIVVDVSVLANALLVGGAAGQRARTVLSRDPEWAAPEHWKAELFSVVRGLTLGGKLANGTAVATLNRIPALGIDHVSLDGLLPTMWRMRNNIAAYDAPYVALAANRNLTLVTADARLAGVATDYCRVELVPG